MKHLQIKVSDEQHRKLKYHCASEGITLNDWLQITITDALDNLHINLKMSDSAQQNERLYIAYGSNLNLRQMKYRCPTAIPITTAELHGYDLKFRGGRRGAVATIEPGEDSVPVLLWKIQPRDESALDAYEGWPNFYRKEDIDVTIGDKTVSAMVYIMNDGHSLGAPSQGYLDAIVEGYNSAGFDTDVLQRALEHSVPEQTQDMEPTGEQMDMDWW